MTLVSIGLPSAQPIHTATPASATRRPPTPAPCRMRRTRAGLARAAHSSAAIHRASSGSCTAASSATTWSRWRPARGSSGRGPVDPVDVRTEHAVDAGDAVDAGYAVDEAVPSAPRGSRSCWLRTGRSPWPAAGAGGAAMPPRVNGPASTPRAEVRIWTTSAAEGSFAGVFSGGIRGGRAGPGCADRQTKGRPRDLRTPHRRQRPRRRPGSLNCARRPGWTGDIPVKGQASHGWTSDAFSQADRTRRDLRDTPSASPRSTEA